MFPVLVMLVEEVDIQNEEPDREENPRRMKMMRRELRERCLIRNLSQRQFQTTFRFPVAFAQHIISAVCRYMKPKRSDGIPPYMKVLVALRLYASGCYQLSVGDNALTSTAQTTVSKVLREVTNVLVTHFYKTAIKFPSTREQLAAAEAEFIIDHNMAEVVGAIDGTHIAIVRPTVNEEAYVNRKGFHSINVQIVSSARGEIINLLPKFPGSCHDAFIWEQSNLNTYMHDLHASGDPHLSQLKLLGDSGYPCQPWLMTPYPSPQGQNQVQFNITHKKTRSLVERTIGVLKAKFRCLLGHRVLHYKPVTAIKIIMACATLFNMAHKACVQFHQHEIDDIDLTHDVYARPPTGEGQRERDAYVDRHFS